MARSSAKPVGTGASAENQQEPVNVPTDDGQPTSGTEGAAAAGAQAGNTGATPGRSRTRSQGFPQNASDDQQSASSATQDDSAKTGGHNPGTGDLIEQLKQQHRQAEALLTAPDAEADNTGTIDRFCELWLPHTVIEEEVIIPAIEKAGGDAEPALAEAEVRRDVVKLLLVDLLRSHSRDPFAAAKLTVLADEVEALIAVEERPETGVLALAQKHGVDLEGLRGRVSDRRRRFQSDTEGETSNALEPSSLRLRGSTTRRQQEEYSNMPSSNYRERDDEGRFTSGNNRGGSRGTGRDRDENGRFTSDDDRGYSSRSSRYDDEDDRRYSRGNDRDRDENGRFVSDDDRRSSRSGGAYYDDDRRYSRSSRDDDDDRRSGGGRGQGGWFGDSEGHSEAARRGWDEREGNGSRSSRDYNDDRRYSGSSRDYDDRRYSSGNDRPRDDNGRFTSDDDRRYSRSSRDDDDYRSSGRGHGGWFGDSEGHSEAARRGWDDREGNGSRSSRSDDDRRYSRSSRDDDDRGSRNGNGSHDHGGWYGDAQGHSEASRRGWENRR